MAVYFVNAYCNTSILKCVVDCTLYNTCIKAKVLDVLYKLNKYLFIIRLFIFMQMISKVFKSMQIL